MSMPRIQLPTRFRRLLPGSGAIVRVFVAVIALVSILSSEGQAQLQMYGTSAAGIFRINSATGAGVQVYSGTPFTGGYAAGAAQRPSDGMLFFVMGSAGNDALYRWDPATPATAPVFVGNTGVPYMPRLGFSTAGILYGVDMGTNSIYVLNQATGAGTASGAGLTGGPAGNTGGDLAIHPTNGYLYIPTGTGNPYTLYRVPVTGGALTSLGTFTGMPCDPSGAAFDAAGTLYIQCSSSNNLYTLPLTGGAVTLVGSSGAAMQDLASVPALPPTVTMSFSPSVLGAPGATSVLTITLTNPASVPQRGAGFTLSYPANLVNAPAPAVNSTCGATATAAAGGGSVALSGGTIPAGGSCTVTVTVTSSTAGTYVVTLSAGGLLTVIGSNASAASATLNVGVTISGTVFEDANYGGGSGRSLAASGGAGSAGARVELYNGAGTYVGFTTTDATGAYSWPNLFAGNYTVRVVNLTVPSSRAGYVAALIPVQTYRTDASSGSAIAVTDHVGGQDPNVVDAANGGAGSTMNTATGVFTSGTSGQAQSIAPVTISGAGDVSGVDFGYSFDVMVNRNTTGQGSLRQVITNANALSNTGLAQQGRPAGIENAIFMLANGTAFAGTSPGYANQFTGGVATINLTAALPTITSALALDAQTQPGWSGLPIIELNGAGAGAGSDGFTISSANNVVSGFVINRFADQGLILTGAGATGNLVTGNYIGLNASGTAASTNGSYGIQILGGASNNTIGGATASARNVISGNGSSGIRIRDAASTGNVILGNFIGLNAAGTGAVGNSAEGVLVNSSATTNTIGGTGVGDGNRIWYNVGDGVYVGSAASDRISILGNSISSNTGLGIDLTPNGVTTNNGTKANNLANDGMDYPVFTSASVNGALLTVAGYIGSAAGQSTFGGARVEIFKSDNDPTGYGEGPVYLGFLTANASGNFSGSVSLGGVVGGDRITGTATDALGNTSEFGANVVVSAPPPVLTLTNTVSPSGAQQPGTDLVYTITFANTGGNAATGVVLADSLTPNVDFKLGSVTSNLGTTGLTVAVAYSNNNGSTYVYTPVSGGGGAPAGYDRNVTTVRWTFTGSLSATPPNHSGSVGLTGRIR